MNCGKYATQRTCRLERNPSEPAPEWAIETMNEVKGDKLWVNLGASQTRRRLKGFGHGVRKVVGAAGRRRRRSPCSGCQSRLLAGEVDGAAGHDLVRRFVIRKRRVVVLHLRE